MTKFCFKPCQLVLASLRPLYPPTQNAFRSSSINADNSTDRIPKDLTIGKADKCSIAGVRSANAALRCETGTDQSKGPALHLLEGTKLELGFVMLCLLTLAMHFGLGGPLRKLANAALTCELISKISF